MGINLKKGGKIDLTKASDRLKKIGFGLGWQESRDSQVDFDLDASAFMLNRNGKIPADEYFVFYNNLNSLDGAVEHTGDNLIGGDENGDDETIYVDLEKINLAIESIVFVVTIHNSLENGQNFGQVKNAFIRVYNLETDKEIAKYNLENQFSNVTSVEFGKLYKKNNHWNFEAIGEGLDWELQDFVDKFN